MSRYQRKLERIRQHNVSLSTIRSQIGDLQKLQAMETKLQVSKKASLPLWISTMHAMSKDAYTALTSAFSCQVDEHIDHFAALKSADSKQPHGSVRLHLGIAYCLNRSYEQQHLLQFSLEFCLPHASWQPLRPSKSKRVQLADDPLSYLATDTGTAEKAHITDLSEIENACVYLENSLNDQTHANAIYAPLARKVGIKLHGNIEEYVVVNRQSESVSHRPVPARYQSDDRPASVPLNTMAPTKLEHVPLVTGHDRLFPTCKSCRPILTVQLQSAVYSNVLYSAAVGAAALRVGLAGRAAAPGLGAPELDEPALGLADEEQHRGGEEGEGSHGDHFVGFGTITDSSLGEEYEGKCCDV
ncbi:hypothetical protein PG994_014503 [Apiospora phragmitis]|uniref:Uncharacterized protein n=1 Tax=Apiospora phragmitis TaxID=2905665 RepID=A0ABR1T642_9PEZI